MRTEFFFFYTVRQISELVKNEGVFNVFLKLKTWPGHQLNIAWKKCEKHQKHWGRFFVGEATETYRLIFGFGIWFGPISTSSRGSPSARVSPLVLCAGSWLSYLGCVRNGGVKWVPTRLCVENLVRFSFEWLLSSGKPSHAFACL